MNLFESLRQNDSTEVEIVHPVKGKVATFTVLSRDSEVMQKAALAVSARRMTKLQHSRRFQVNPEEIAEESVELLVKATVAWTWEAGYDLEFTPANVRRCYADPGFSWIRKQVDEAMGDSELFFEK